MDKHRKIVVFLVSITLFCFAKCTSQSISHDTGYFVINGNIYDSISKKGIPEAAIYITKKIGVVSDSYGNFTLKIPRKFARETFTIQFSEIGYKTMRLKIGAKRYPPNRSISIALEKLKLSDIPVLIQ